MIAILEVRGPVWFTRAQFEEYGLSGRECRAGREAAHGRIIAGQSGYKLLRHATQDEAKAWRNILTSQKTAAERSIVDHDKRLAAMQYGRRSA